LGFGGVRARGVVFDQLLVSVAGFFSLRGLEFRVGAFGDLGFEELCAFGETFGGGLGNASVELGDLEEAVDCGVAEFGGLFRIRGGFHAILLDFAEEEEGVGAEIRGCGWGADNHAEEALGFIELAFGAESFRDAVVGFENFWRPRVKGFELLE